MALQLYDHLEKTEKDLPLPDDHRFSISSDDEKLNELDPLHSNGHAYTAFDEHEDHPLRSLPVRKDSLAAERPQHGFLSRAEARARRIKRWKSRIFVPGRLCCAFCLVVATITLAVIGGSGYWVVKQVSNTIDGRSPSWYPSPKGGTSIYWQESYTKAAAMVSKMSLAEKVNITTGTGWMNGLCVGNTGPALHSGFPALCLQDGPLGVRFADHITASPAGITVGATWNKELMYKRGKMLGLEYRMKGINIMLGPSVGPLGKLPAGGRNWEGFGSDPVLQGLAAAETIKGIQGEGVIATIKHYVANEQEHFRQPFEWTAANAISSNVDDRTLHEIYVWPFADSIKAGVASVMCSYNQVNNSYACQNSKILNGVLKDELGFQGFVQSDWTAQHSGVDSALAGLDMAMPGGGIPNGAPFWGHLLTQAILNGSLPIERLDDMVTRVVAAWYQLGQDDVEKWPRPPPEGEGGPNFSSWTNDEIGLIHAGTDDRTTAKVNHFVDAQSAGSFSHSSLARRIAAEGIVLLKNSGGILPLSRTGWPQSVSDPEVPVRRRYRIAVVGEDSVLPEGGPNVCPDRGCNRGTLASGWGSGAVEFQYLVSPLEALQNVFHGDDVELKSFPTNDVAGSDLQDMDLCIVFANADAGEGYLSWDGVNGDRNDLFLQKHGDKLINTVATNCGSKNPNAKLSGGVIVVLHSVGPVILESFIDISNVRAVLSANLPGQESGHALTDVLLGDVNPSGHLPYTIGKSLEDYGPGARIIYKHLGDAPQQNFSEGLLIDYRWFDSQDVAPRFPFGYGLSYTTFELENMQIRTTLTGGSRPESLPSLRPADETQPPAYGSVIPDPSELVFPSGFKRLKNYIYPYIDNVKVVEKGDYPYPDMTPQPSSAAGGGQGGNPSLWEIVASVDVTVVNTGSRDGQAVVQLYLSFPNDVYEYFENPEGELGAQEDLRNAEEGSLIHGGMTDSKDDGVDKRADLSGPDHHLNSFRDVESVENDISTDESLSSQSHPEEADPVQGNSDSKIGSFFSDSVPDFISSFKKPREKIDFPPRVLRAFEKVHTYTAQDGDGSSLFQSAKNGADERVEGFSEQRKTVTFNLTRRDLSYWSVRQQNWVLPNGRFRIEVGFDSRDIRLKGNLF